MIGYTMKSGIFITAAYADKTAMVLMEIRPGSIFRPTLRQNVQLDPMPPGAAFKIGWLFLRAGLKALWFKVRRPTKS